MIFFLFIFFFFGGGGGGGGVGGGGGGGGWEGGRLKLVNLFTKYPNVKNTNFWGRGGTSSVSEFVLRRFQI